ncbi:phosphonate metabolism protein/1,5-bisphosphokinase (PRPP-forming) PhnN [Mesobacterium sp. TK19101]|uniref:Ribose 1,5-bisphosphate phosphokinase PhnN n=1 Tax=Mesobacterium hydrothermale TaxID=3111907 RepID=A0ABU6HJP4_9RHOB|nr:phosphonate metabolism protein/1,5-bisphosphokinase (PRPP-forming) PhnN [Mesobacterium sp. TK19101]MEC3862582.1 phosphonate metabolism protein/1,5-bisphosphokinase (PRPP-forming) PhnN [Mesobacterium sp. TK19101]
MNGRLIAVVGPSGVGKDSVMAGIAAAAPGIRPVRRVITRPREMGGEIHIAASEMEFARLRDAGGFCLHWDAHGLSYGIPVKVLRSVQDGAERMVNLSRAVLPEAQALFPALTVLHVTARPETLALRLAGRGRESAEEIARRLDRAGHGLPAGIAALDLPNDGPLDDTVARALRLLQPERV